MYKEVFMKKILLMISALFGAYSIQSIYISSKGTGVSSTPKGKHGVYVDKASGLKNCKVELRKRSGRTWYSRYEVVCDGYKHLYEYHTGKKSLFVDENKVFHESRVKTLPKAENNYDYIRANKD